MRADGGQRTLRGSRQRLRHPRSGIRVRMHEHRPRIPRRQREPEGRAPRRTRHGGRAPVRGIGAASHRPPSAQRLDEPRSAEENQVTPTHDVVLVGGGGAGLRAAIAIAETSPRLRIAVVSKVYPMRSHTVSAEGGAAAVIKSDDSLDEHAYDTISGGDWMSDQDAVEAFVKEAPKEMLQLEHWGCPWNREPDGHIAVRAFGGMKKKRTWFAADKTGFHMLHTLFQTSLKYPNITRYDEWFVTRLLEDDGRVQGVVAIELMTGKVQTILAKA